MQLAKLDKLKILSICLIALATVFMVISVSTNSWYKTQDLEGIVASELGLWKACIYGGTGEPCSSLKDNQTNGKFVSVYTFTNNRRKII